MSRLKANLHSIQRGEALENLSLAMIPQSLLVNGMPGSKRPINLAMHHQLQGIVQGNSERVGKERSALSETSGMLVYQVKHL